MLGRIDDEAALRSKEHPDHTSGWREGISAGVAICIGGWMFFSLVNVPWLPVILKIVIVVASAGLAGWFFVRWIGGASRRQRIKANREYREHMDVAKAKQLKEAKETGAFDRWEK